MTVNSKVLADSLSSKRTPVLTWLGPAGERVELGGPVARRWLAKTDNFLAEEFPFGAAAFSVFLPAHWRSPFWILPGWLRGLTLTQPRSATELDLAVSDDIAFLRALQDDFRPDVLVAQTLDSYAFAWDGELPFGISDGTADVMAYADEVESPVTAAPGSRLLGAGEKEAGEDDLALALARLGLASPTLGDLDQRDWVGAGVDLAGQRVLLTTADPRLAAAQMLQVWLAGGSVVWAPRAKNEDAIANSENVTVRAPGKFSGAIG